MEPVAQQTCHAVTGELVGMLIASLLLQARKHFTSLIIPAERRSSADVHRRKLMALPLQAKISKGAPCMKGGVRSMLREYECVTLHS